ncbi:LysR family transcriptional regulator [Ruegeria sp. 2012CJ41-6]|uniref:LysR family transcriptional regulator n=1 Tax=Ruegeria spongiae TaxID=2942209 RepID=A0ABT0Q727_9RHOB|nr:LysR substrate-binding domain-containing protein [Ruegeria spongiae]MCL6285686.1 LysR family transcriptional regulator [Ruegeria spongiae]
MIAKHIGTLLALEAIDRHGSFTAAAHELGVSQSAVSMKIVRLERDLKVRLVERTTRSVILSKEGKMLVQSSRSAINELEVALAEVQKLQNEGVLTVEVLSSIASKWLIPHLGGFHKKNPDITVNVTIQDNQTEPLGADADVSLRIAKSALTGLHSEFLTYEAVFPVCSPELAHELRERPLSEAVKVAPLLDDRMALEDGSGCNWQDQFPELDIQSTNRCGQHLIFDRTDLALQAAISGQGLAIGRTFLCLDEIERGNLVAPFGVTSRLKWGYYLVSRKSISDWPKLMSFKTWLVDELQNLQERAKVLKIWYEQ